jgi:hypothetical protein
MARKMQKRLCSFWISEEELAEAKQNAAAARMSFSQFIRTRILSETSGIPPEIAELAKHLPALLAKATKQGLPA